MAKQAASSAPKGAKKANKTTAGARRRQQAAGEAPPARTEARARPSDTGPERINGDLAPLVVPIRSLKPDPANANTHPDRSLASLRWSLERFGQQKPVVALRDGTVVAGNGLLLAARELTWKRLACVRLDTDDANEARAFALADNRTAQLAEWDFPQLAATLKDLHLQDYPLDALWADFELEPLLNANFTPATPTDHNPIAGQGGVRPVLVSVEQRDVFERACEKMRQHEDDPEMSEGRCLELMAAEYLS